MGTPAELAQPGVQPFAGGALARYTLGSGRSAPIIDDQYVE